MSIESLYQVYLEHPSVQTDTRKLKQGDIFFALKGPNFNGNLFALQALQNGAAYAVVDEPVDEKNERLVLVEDVLSTLQQLGRHHRLQFNIPFIAVTGSNGKTTTKELVSTVLASHFTTYTTEGNLNNHIGIPVTLLSIKKDAQMAVIEMGANHQGEIADYCTYVLPTHGIITNCGKAHLEGFGGIEGVKKGKGELFDYLRQNNGSAFIFSDYDYLREMSNGIREVYRYGTTDANTTGRVITSEPFLTVGLTGDDNSTIQTQLVGEYNLPNVLCAVAVGRYFKVPADKITNAISGYAPSNSRSQMMNRGTNHIILDAYNANPSSMKAAIENFAKIRADKKVLLLGAMMELGQESIAEHQDIVRLLQQYNWDQVVLVGGDYSNIAHPFIYLEDASAARSWYQKQQLNDAYVLIKGSRSMKMEKVLED
ncbi:MAG: UDP-N-acetylmuramoyl-tripeptide--D-alanyl-D-alanine ligase [Chitinophagaceae bacterium]|jgi:UDP-N-acetylmuramoyl-tripeptide--D-alanyl-D-alanine ligase|nr:UDP-N-acetylmuramoyl-tripeptide--D-alanyl-D-alanine ligase [Chitinophagaceae bacterium]